MNSNKIAPPIPIMAKYSTPLLNFVSKPKYTYETQSMIMPPTNNDNNGVPEIKLINKIGMQ